MTCGIVWITSLAQICFQTAKYSSALIKH